MIINSNDLPRAKCVIPGCSRKVCISTVNRGRRYYRLVCGPHAFIGSKVKDPFRHSVEYRLGEALTKKLRIEAQGKEVPGHFLEYIQDLQDDLAAI